ncbi:GNAT family N-acetyltransferase [Lampropedia puyangensis]|uniref:GNAT family N-acetyltransferase n=1 Tax=Lampropedia puyangensis TaxID=1330072 RepID=A0A4S8F839_9BURK|nr:GNAT family N-acetyltransferase [Lampropedia puyangensis]THU02825.1 GNAT family N-acetyltransferase [Lampropedia puyangensis]
MPYSITPLLPADIDALLSVQASAYPAQLLEDADFFLNRLALSPGTCWAAKEKQTQRMLGYLIAYPWHAGLPPALNEKLVQIPQPATHWFLHDCAVATDAQGLGVGQALYAAAIEAARQDGFDSAALVALASATTYWQARGFNPPMVHSRDLQEKLAAYGPGASYLMRPLKIAAIA